MNLDIGRAEIGLNSSQSSQPVVARRNIALEEIITDAIGKVLTEFFELLSCGGLEDLRKDRGDLWPDIPRKFLCGPFQKTFLDLAIPIKIFLGYGLVDFPCRFNMVAGMVM